MDFSKVLSLTNPTLTMTSNLFKLNTAERDGGGVCLLYADNQAPTILFDKTNFTLNGAGLSGGAIFYHSFNNRSNFTIQNSNITKNDAASGGGFRHTGQTIYYDSTSTIYNNTARRYGPDIAAYGVLVRENPNAIWSARAQKNTTNTSAYRLLQVFFYLNSKNN